MNIVEFKPRSPTGGWLNTELAHIVDAVRTGSSGRRIGNWDVGVTEAGDPQFYLLTPPPENDCVLCISRVGSTYVLEDGCGRIVSEHNSLTVLATELAAYLRKQRRGFFARLALIWCALRQNVEQKVEAAWAECEELIVHIAPQTAAFI